MKPLSLILLSCILLISSYIIYMMVTQGYPIHLLLLTIVLLLLALCFVLTIVRKHKDNYTEIIEDIETIMQISKNENISKESITTFLHNTSGRLIRMLDERLIR